jgi:hypothetical protein
MGKTSPSPKEQNSLGIRTMNTIVIKPEITREEENRITEKMRNSEFITKT